MNIQIKPASRVRAINWNRVEDDKDLEVWNRLIPTSANQNRCAQSRIPIDMIFHGCATSLFHASQQWETMSS
ncbi:hypothetical protein SAMN05216228_10032 [Rhizobium tibeticum]|uniref:Uncharacterized protein n=1 Tax=Rhizobium tibeticum TaxID=501024 RepID=A0ABY1AG35_9HYPH|nr:hypothetical protein SAMN05216228_10032 [Rhizobium tibeticum]